MTRDEQVKYWLDLADYDLDTAEAMHQTGRWLYVAFMCHQVIEKTLKAYWCATQPTAPPYTHSHQRLASGSGIYDLMNDDQRDFLDTTPITTSRPATPKTKKNSPAHLHLRHVDKSLTKPNRCSNG